MVFEPIVLIISIVSPVRIYVRSIIDITKKFRVVP